MQDNKHCKTIAIDFDGVINDYKGFKGKGIFEKIIAGASNNINRLYEEGNTIIINSCRSETDDIKSFLKENDIKYHYINHNPDNKQLGLSDSKIIADFYIDDRAIEFFGDWDFIYDYIHIKDVDKIFKKHLQQVLKTKMDGTKRYGTKAWNSLGAKGVFVDLNRKFQRLKYYVWEDNKEMSSESIKDTCYDLACYSIMMLMTIVEEGQNEK